MNAESLTRALGGQWRGSYGTARCPAHEDKTPSLSISDGDGDTLLTHCHARCSPEAVWTALQDQGHVERHDDRRTQSAPRRPRQSPNKPISEPSPNQDHALEIWRAARPVTGTPAETYLRGRGTLCHRHRAKGRRPQRRRSPCRAGSNCLHRSPRPAFGVWCSFLARPCVSGLR